MKLLFPQVPTKEQIKAALEQHLPQFQYSFRIGKFVDCKQSFFIGATIVPKKDGIVINSSFPSAGANMFFTLFMIGTGILVGLVVWLAVWKKGQDKVREQVERVLGQVFGATNQLPAAPGQPQLAQGQQPMAHGQQPHMQAPHGQPMGQPHMQPHGQPMGQPHMQPHAQPHGQPMGQPHMQPHAQPHMPPGQPHMPPPGQQHMQPQSPHQHQQHQPQMQQPQAQGLAPGMKVFVAPGDGQRYPATVVSAANGQYQCMMPNGQPYWFPAQNVSVS